MRRTTVNYQNVIEILVAREVDRQIRHLPPQLVAYIKPEDVMAYALNRLPPLYATSLEGRERQQHHAKTQLLEKIVIAVRQGIAAVQQDPIKVKTPLE
ncbi:MAG TPA: late competence development ComFB family protein [Coleofasciculaceae cyanobacterium]|jgi:hypothetical protein